MSQCFISGPNDDTPEPAKQTNLFSLAALRARRDRVIRKMDETIRMVERQRAGDASFTGPGCGVTLAETANALDDFLRATDALKGEVVPARPLPVARPFGRRTRDADLPAVASVGGL